jgi:hypothetical protein
MALFFSMRIFKLNKRITELEIAITRDLLNQDDGAVIKSILETQERLYRSGGFVGGEEALKEAKRLHGFK